MSGQKVRMRGISHTTRGIAARSTNAGRQVVRTLPAPTRARVRGMAAWLSRRRPAPPLEDWSRPLVRTRQGTGLPHDVLTETPAADADVIEPTVSLLPDRVSGDDVPQLRCLLVTDALDVGGMDEVVAFLARRLPARRIQTAVLHARSDPSATGEPRGRLGRMLRSNGIEVHEADERSAPGWIERWRPDIISAHRAPDWVLTAAQRLSVPYVDTLHGMHYFFGAAWRAETTRSASLAAIVAVSETVRQQYLAGNRLFRRSGSSRFPTESTINDARAAIGKPFVAASD